MTETTKISRRSVAKGIAWSVPAVAVSAAVPAYATSGRGVVFDVTNSTWCGNDGSGWTQVKWCFRLGGASSATVKITSISIKNGNGAPVAFSVKQGDSVTQTINVTSTLSCSQLIQIKPDIPNQNPVPPYTMTVNFTVTTAEGVTSTGSKQLTYKKACTV